MVSLFLGVSAVPQISSGNFFPRVVHDSYLLTAECQIVAGVGNGTGTGTVASGMSYFTHSQLAAAQSVCPFLG